MGTPGFLDSENRDAVFLVEIVEFLRGANVWDNTVFVTTMEDQLSQPETASTKKADWEKYLKETCLIPHPVMVNYIPAVPQSLEPLRSKYASCKPTTPEL